MNASPSALISSPANGNTHQTPTAAHAVAIAIDSAQVTRKKVRRARGDIEQLRRASMLNSLDWLSTADKWTASEVELP